MSAADLPLRFRYQTLDLGELELHVRTLRNQQEYSDHDGAASRLGISSETWPLFGLIWASGTALAELMVTQDVAGKRILEVGCGIGLASLVLNHRLADITATDIHPEAAGFMSENTRINQDRAIPFMRSGWSDAVTELGEFDLIIGSDLLYERSHVIPLAAFIDQHAKRECEVILIDPGRGHHANFSKRMIKLGYSHSQTRTASGEADDALPRGRVLNYRRKAD
ncbi:MAG: methyltransferase domain-containing protein [Xanthomonadales bacterium]|nr:methyltransferase domain-containing protein [Xanthomonadales bacterium]